jgi:Ca2+-transporting ATPase
VTALITVAVAAFSKGETPLNVIQLLYVNLVMDTFAAVSLASTPPADGLMKKTPEHRDQFVITTGMLWRIIPQTTYQLLAQLTVYFLAPTLTTMSAHQLSGFMFNTFIFCQLFNLVNVVSPDSMFPLFQVRGKRVLIASCVLLVGIQTIIMMLLGGVFQIDRITRDMWALSTCIGLGSSVVHAIVVGATRWLED